MVLSIVTGPYQRRQSRHPPTPCHVAADDGRQAGSWYVLTWSL